MGFFDRLKRGRDTDAIRVRCAMCKVATDYGPASHGEFVIHSCDSDLLVARRDPELDREALTLLVAAYRAGTPRTEDAIAARDRLLYELGEGKIPGLEDLLYRIKYEPREAWPFAELRPLIGDGGSAPLRIDWGNELEMYLHRMKKYAITRRQIERVAESARPILRDKLERLKTDPLVPLEED
jgi:hypothetical protein